MVLKFFFPTYNGLRFFQHYTPWAIFFSVQDIFLPGIYLHAFFLSKSVCRTFFLKSPITPSKVKWSAPKIHQTFGQLTDSDLSIISKGFWNNRGQNSLGERGGIRFYLPLPGKSVRTDRRRRHNQIFSDGWFTKFYYPIGAMLRAEAPLYEKRKEKEIPWKLMLDFSRICLKFRLLSHPKDAFWFG